MKKYNMITPEGTKDVLFEECIEKRYIQKKVTEIFISRGYNEVITPGLEYYDVFDIDGAKIPQYEMYKTTDNNGRLVVFRPDLTLPIARLTATRLKNAELPLRLFYNQNVYRNRPDLTGRSDESTQAGIELMGVGGLRADLEVITTAVETIKACTDNFRIEIGHAEIFRIFADKLNVSADIKEKIRATIESKNYGALSVILDEIPNSDYKKAIGKLPSLFGGEEVFEEAALYCTDTESKGILDYLKSLYKALTKLGLGDKIIVDLGLVQRNDYYTGVVFSAYAYGHGDAVVMGGRYDNLLEKFNAPMPAVGFAIDVDAITKILGYGANELITPNVLVHADCGFEIEGLLEQNRITELGKICEFSICENREKSKEYAKSKGIKEIVFVGKSEKGQV